MLLPNEGRGLSVRPTRIPSSSPVTSTEVDNGSPKSRGLGFGRSCAVAGIVVSVLVGLGAANPVFAGSTPTRTVNFAKAFGARVPAKHVKPPKPAKSGGGGKSSKHAKADRVAVVRVSAKDRLDAIESPAAGKKSAGKKSARKTVDRTVEKSAIKKLAAKPAESSVPKLAAKPEIRTYRVKPGDSLSLIAFRQDTTIGMLRTMNGLTSNAVLRVDQVLKVPPLADPNGLPLRLRRTPERLALRKETALWAKRNQIPVDLLEATLWHESGFNQSRVSSTGAIGIGQLMPGTSDFIERELIGKDLDPHNPSHNIRMSARYLRFLLQQSGGDSTKALYAYYQGAGSIQAHGLYDDTIQYARNIQSLRKRFRNH